ncbi:MAG: TraB/GumN family protein [bacterium]
MKFKKLSVFQIYAAVLVLTFLFQVSASAEDKNCLWRIKTDNNTVYFLGSIHMLKKECYPLDPAIQDAYHDAQIVVFEVNIDSSQSFQAQQKIMVKAISKDTTSLKDKLNSDTYQRAACILSEAGVNISQFNMFEPWFFSISLMAMKIQQLGFDPSYGIDYHFFNKAKQNGKQILSLETIDFQIDLFDELNSEDQEAIVKQTLDEIDLLEEELDKMINLWVTGDAEQLAEMVIKNFRDYPRIYNKFLIERNKRWLDLIESLLKDDKNSLIITGTAHLLGDEGVLSLLERKKYIIEQL